VRLAFGALTVSRGPLAASGTFKELACRLRFKDVTITAPFSSELLGSLLVLSKVELKLPRAK
jgi:hypothetical protein